MGSAESATLKSTQAFIDENAFDFVFRRPTWENTEAGGRRKNGPPTTLPPQTGRFVESGLSGDRSPRTLPDGRVVNVYATIVLMPDMDVEMLDLTTYKGQQYEVVSVRGRWATDAEVAKHASH